MRKLQTHCGKGHEQTPENVRYSQGKRVCRLCGIAYCAAWNKAHALQHSRLSKESYQRLRDAVIAAYGGKCVCCGIDDHIVLDLDHIHGGGTKHLKAIGGLLWYRQVRDEGFPRDKYQLLCRNCNWAKYRQGYCSHQLQRLEWVS
jgi:hypothetical protein